MGTTTLAILAGLVYTLFKLLAEWRSGGLGGIKRHWQQGLSSTLAVACCVWGLLFGYHLFFRVPDHIYQEASTNRARLRPISGVIPVPTLFNSETLNRLGIAHQKLKLVFKEPDQFSVVAKRVISDEMQRMHDFLIDVGFDLSAEVPPLRIHAGGAVGMSWESPGTVYDEQLFVPTDGISDAETIRNLYALWVFRRMFRSAPFSPLGGGTFHANYNHLEVMSSLYSCYYRSGLANRNVCPHDWSGSSWMKAIWNIRQRYGREFTDSAMLFTVKAWGSFYRAEPTFDAFFKDRFLKGVSVLSYDVKLLADIEKILHDHGLGIQ